MIHTPVSQSAAVGLVQAQDLQPVKIMNDPGRRVRYS
jgi:hypothetical protein